MNRTKNINIALAQIEIEPGRPDFNFQKILEVISAERKKLTDLIVFPEMALPGYMIGDQWENKSFLEDLTAYNQDIARLTAGLTVVWGNVATDPTKTNHDGSVRKYNAALVAQDGDIVPNRIYKTNLPTYRQFHDSRHFTSAAELAREENHTLREFIQPVDLKIKETRIKLGILLCEDMWYEDYGPEFNIASILADKGTDLLINLSCSPWGLDKNNKRHRVVAGLFPTNQKRPPFLYVNNVGMQDIGKTIFHFDGGTALYDADGQIISECPKNQEDILRVSLDQHKQPVVERKAISKSEPKIKEIKNSIVSAMKSFVQRTGLKRIVIGLSGGIDSAVSTALWTEAIGAKNVFAVNMPTRYNSSTTKNIAGEIAKNLDVNYSVTPIENDFNNTVRELEELVFRNSTGKEIFVKLSPINKENIQSRLRGSTILSGLASAIDGAISCNGNKDEFAFGYATLYGDIVGALAPLGDLLKGQVYDLAREINLENNREIIPSSCINELVASAELGEDQNVDQGKGDPFLYPYHDALTRHFIELLHQPEDILALLIAGKFEELGVCEAEVLQYFGSKEKLVTDLENKWAAFHKNVFKRYQAPPIIKVSPRAFGYDFHESQVSPYFSRKYLDLKKIYLLYQKTFANSAAEPVKVAGVSFSK